MLMRLLVKVTSTASAAVMLLAVSVGPAAAQGTGPYVGLGVGQATTDLCDDLGIPSSNCDDKDTGIKIFGGYNFNQNFGLEVGWIDLGEVKVTGPGGSASVEVDGFQLAAVGTYPINPQFSIFGKIGVYMWDASVSSTVGISGSDDGTDLMFGAGVGWNFTPNLALRAEWEHFDFDDNGADLLSASIVFRF